MTHKNPSTETFLNRPRDLIVCLFLITATLVVYWQVKEHEFINYDDEAYVTENYYVKTGLTLESVAWAFTATDASNWHPLTWLSHMLDTYLFGLAPGWSHLINVLFHIVNTLLLFLVLRRMTGTLWRSGFVAALFALHPLHVESVAWVAERKDVLSTFFWMLTILGYARYVERPGLNRYLPVLLFFVLGLMAKPMLVTLPFVLLLLDYWPLGRFQLGQIGDGGGSQQRSAFLRLVWEKTPLFVFAVASCVVTFLVQQKGGAVGLLNVLPFSARVANALVSYVSYISKMVWPYSLAVFYPYNSMLPGWQIAGACFLLVSISFLAIRAARRQPYFTMGWLWYLGTLVPVIGLVQVGLQSMADRYTYVPLIGIFVIIAWGVPELVARWSYRKLGLAAIGAALLSILTATSWFQVRHWRNSTALFEHALEVTVDNYVAHTNLGDALRKGEKIEEAIVHYQEALRIAPYHADTHNDLGFVLMKNGKIETAMAHFLDALRIKPDHELAISNLGLALIDQGKLDEAIQHYSDALRITPESWRLRSDLGDVLIRLGKIEEGIAQCRESIRIKPIVAAPHYNWGRGLFAQGRFDEAIGHFSEALRIKPDFAEAHNNLGAALFKKGKIEEAIARFREALRIKPDYPLAYKNLTVALAKQEKTNETMAKNQVAPKITYSDPTFNYKLGNSYNAQGKLNEAIEEYKKALSMRPDFFGAMNDLALTYVSVGEYEKALPLYMRMMELQPDSYIAYYNTACLYAKQNKVDESINWLKQAINQGFRDWDHLKSDEDLENIRSTSYFKELAQRAKKQS